MPRAFVVYMLLLIAVLPASLITWAYAGFGAAQAVSMGGTAGTVIGTLIYVAVWDSRDRWPGTTARQRLVNVLTFTR